MRLERGCGFCRFSDLEWNSFSANGCGGYEYHPRSLQRLSWWGRLLQRSSDGWSAGGRNFASICQADHVHASDTSRAPAAGSSNIVTLGTITTGIWNGTLIPVLYGGTGTATGSITGTGALVFTAGGANSDVTLTPTGTGKTVISSAVIQIVGDSGALTSGVTSCAGLTGAITRDSNGDLYIASRFRVGGRGLLLPLIVSEIQIASLWVFAHTLVHG